MKLFKRRRATRELRRFAAEMPHEVAAAYMRLLADAGAQRSTLIMAERARDTAPTPELARHYQRWVTPLREGRRVRTATFPVTILEPVPSALAEAVEEALEGVDE